MTTPETGAHAMTATGRIPAPEAACRAVQYSDMMICAHCGRRCDTHEPNPPQCPLTLRRMRTSGLGGPEIIRLTPGETSTKV